MILFFLVFNSAFIFASTVDTIKVVSKSMNKSISNIVILPNNYSTQKKSFPVLYLLHGASGSYTDWISKVPSIKEYADQYQIIIVCPDGGHNSWYFDSPIDKNINYETYISKELINTIDKKYNTSAQKSGRAITDLSMGGHGAFYLAFKHQDIWGAAGSMSGGMDLRAFSSNWGLPKLLGKYSEHKESWEKNTVINMVYLLEKDSLKLIFDCGINDFFYDANKRLHKKLIERNIPHDFIERPGAHNWEYWSNSIKYQLLFFNDYFKS
ncbi:esterase family protein [Polaribacter sp. MSW13]|uniref:Esterase family protein n=1 Tax=Polaribacter marinus TaxID=2916838 RepID=A0A9X1VNI9_9FLAO|nr:alpha/beta hydrolase family protein [Polaribacter marinus]MCI2227695.1 esterase family protein [Polaribacter marinus]